MQKLLCLDAQPTFLNAFDFSVAPSLLFYSYIPIVIFLLSLSLFIARKDNFALKSKMLLTLAVSFSLWVFNIIIQWIAVEADIVYFAWQNTALLEILIPLSTIYLTYVFIDGKDIGFWLKYAFVLLVSVVALLLPTNFNMLGFDINNCEALVGPLLYFVYGFELFAVLWILGFSIKRYFEFRKNKILNVLRVKQLILTTVSSTLFLLIFSLSNIAGELTQIYSINLFGPIGMVIFVSLMSYMIVKFRTFNIKLLATQLLVWGLTVLIGAQFFFIRNPINYVLNGITFIASLFFGQLLIEAVKAEVAQKEYLQALNTELQGLIKQRESLVHLITHKVKGSFTRTKYLFSEMLDGTFGELSPILQKMVKRGFDSDVDGVYTVDLVLNSSNLQNGTVKYNMKPIDFKEIIVKIFGEKKASAESKGLNMSLEVEDGNYTVLGDSFWLKEVAMNLFENAIRYTLQGSITVKLMNKEGKVLLSVLDTGVGITEEDKKNLFKEGGRGKDSVKINVDSTGYGLFSVKLIVDAHKGRIWAESQGANKGSAFHLELEAVK